LTSRDIRYARSGDVNVAYEVLGEGGGVDVLRIAAFVSSLQAPSLPVWEEMTSRLASLGRLIRYDNRGTGLSDRVRGARLPPLEDRVDDLRAILDAAGSRRAVLACFADGGPLGCLFAATHPERTMALILCNTGPRIAWATDYPWGLRPEEADAWLDDIGRRWGTHELAERDARESPWAGVAHEELVEWHLANMRASAGPGDAALAFRMYLESDARGVLNTIRVPTLVLSRGGAMAEGAAATAGLIPGAQHRVMPGAAPSVIAEHPEAYHDEIERFVRELEAEEEELESVLATVLFTDIVDSTAQQASRGDRGWGEIVERHHRIVRSVLVRYRGRELDTAGDGFFAAFDGPARAIRCARAIVEQVKELGIEVRAGLHTGECRTVDGKPGGLAVSIGARVTSMAGPSEVLVSQTVKDLVAGSGLVFDDRGEHELKGVPDAWRIYAVA
jgi:class 3 adenylate cyclase